MKIRYFAWLRDSLGCNEEQIALPVEVKNVGMLLDWLGTRGDRYEKALEFAAVVLVSVNGSHAGRDHPVSDGDEVLLVPPIAGG